MGMDNLVPDRPSGFNGQCRSKLSMAGDAAQLGSSALTPPVIGAVGPLVNGAKSAADNLAKGNIGDALGGLLGSIPAAAGGFFGGGVGADVARGIANEGATALGANRDNLPDSSASNLARDATCKTPPTTLSGADVPAPRQHVGPTVTENRPTSWGRMTTTYRP
jgi:hypothetical protein